MKNYYDRDDLYNLFYRARIAHTLNDGEKRELRRTLALISRRNSRTLADSWHCVRVNRECTTFFTVCKGIDKATARHYAQRVFEWAEVKTVHTRKVKTGVTIRVNVYNEEVFA